MKNSIILKKRNSFVSVLAAGVIAVTGLVSTTLPAYAAESTSLTIEQQIFEVCQYQSTAVGATLTSADEEMLMAKINKSISKCALDNNCSYAEAGELILAEIMMESGLDSLPQNVVAPYGGGGGIGYVEVYLPASTAGDIFYADNEWAWNHVGMYAEPSRIIESTPDYGVHNASIYSSTAVQHRAPDNTNDSCILRVKNLTSTQKGYAIKWANNQVGKAYETWFMSNKDMADSENESFNCSELVWKAYMYGCDDKGNNVLHVDLDGNGGDTVYPNNIKDSDKVTKVCGW